MAGKKVGSDGQVRKTTAEWAADTATYPEGMRLMNTDTGAVRVSKGTTYALAWTPSTSGGSSAWGEITGTLSDQTDLQAALDAKASSSDLTGISAPTATFSTNTNTAQDPGQDTVRFNSGTIGSVTEIALSDVVGGVDKGDLNSRCAGILQLRTVGTTETIEFLITGIVHTSWTRYTVTYLKGALPANGTVMAVRFIPVNVVTQSITNGETATSPSEDAVFDALAGKAKVIKVNGTAQPRAVIEVWTGTTDVNGEMSFDLSAYASVKMIAPFIDRTKCDEVEVVDDTPATYTVAFRYQSADIGSYGAQVTLLCTP